MSLVTTDTFHRLFSVPPAAVPDGYRPLSGSPWLTPGARSC